MYKTTILRALRQLDMEHNKSEGFKGQRAIVTPYVIREMQSKDEIAQQLFVTHIGYYPNAKYHYRERVSGTSENILIFCEQGSGWIDYAGERHVLRENQLFIVPAGEAHAYGADNADPWSIYWLHFSGMNVRMFNSIFGRVLSFEGEKQDRRNMRMVLFDEMFNSLSMGYAFENLQFVSFSLTYLLSTIKYAAQYSESRPIENDAIRSAIHYMRNHLETKTSLQNVADHVGYSTSHLNALFVKGTSFSPMEYFNQLRIQRVCYYLQFSDLKIKEIAFKLGFYDPFHLSRCFVKEMQISPKAYRSKYNVQATS